jgi:hypothetical protein
MTIDRALDAALDRYTLPPLSEGFADRVTARAATRPVAVAPSDPFRDRRGGWMRGHRVLIGVGALSLMSAAAAATGMFGDVAKNVPVLGPLIASVAPAKHAPPPALVRHVAVEAKKAPLVPRLAETPLALEHAAPIDIAPPLVEPSTIQREVRRDLRREFIARRIARRIEQRRLQANTEGVPPQQVRPGQFIKRWRELPQEERIAIRQRVREIRQGRRMQAQSVREVVPESIAPLPGTDLAR